MVVEDVIGKQAAAATVEVNHLVKELARGGNVFGSLEKMRGCTRGNMPIA